MANAQLTLPSLIPVFPLDGALLLPDWLLPLHIFEPRYVAMVEDALAGDKLIGMTQPDPASCWPCGAPKLKKIGCSGRIVDHQSTDDGRHLITLLGKKRFEVVEELAPLRGYRRATVRWIDEPELPILFDRTRLVPALRRYLDKRQLQCDWQALTTCPDDKLFTILSMVCPFSACEQQALLEAPSGIARAQLLVGLLEMAELDNCTNKPMN